MGIEELSAPSKTKSIKNRWNETIASKLRGETMWPLEEEKSGETDIIEKKGKVEALIEMLRSRRGQRHLIVLHAYPDPDAISTAYTHRLISTAYGIESDVVYMGEISHPQNQTLIRMLGNNFHRFSEDMDLDQYQGAIFLDHQGSTVEPIVTALEMARVPIIAVIDHHQPQDRFEAEFVDIQHIGATATIYADYLEQGVLEMDNAIEEHRLAATALIHGILTDTQNYLRATARDFRASAYLARFRDVDKLVQVMRLARSKHSMDITQRALANRLNVENYSIAGIGYVRPEDRDAIPQAAEFLLTEENVHTAMVFGIVTDPDEGDMLVGSLRTAKFNLDPDEFLKDLLGKDEKGRYYGGGRPLAGGFAVQVGFLSDNPDEQYRQMKWQVYDEQIKHRIFAKIGVGK